MGKNKLKIRRLESHKERCDKYSKRKKGILKKAKELAVLCDVDVAMVLFSPTDKPTFFHTPSKSLKDIMEKFISIPSEEREERRSYTMKKIKKLMEKNKIELLPGSNEVTEDANKANRLEKLEGLIAEKESILWDWENPETIYDLEELERMEEELSLSLEHIRRTLEEQNQMEKKMKPKL